jgi:hypothetical protein
VACGNGGQFKQRRNHFLLRFVRQRSPRMTLQVLKGSPTHKQSLFRFFWVWMCVCVTQHPRALFSILNLHRHTSALPLMMTACAPRPAARQPASAASRRRRHNTHNSLNGLTDVYDTVSPFGCSSGLVLSSPSPLPRKRPTPNVASREQSSASPPF